MLDQRDRARNTMAAQIKVLAVAMDEFRDLPDARIEDRSLDARGQIFRLGTGLGKSCTPEVSKRISQGRLLFARDSPSCTLAPKSCSGVRKS